MKPILWITGAAGFSGRCLSAYLRSLPDPPRSVGLDVHENAALALDAFHAVDLADADAVARLAGVEPPRWVIHLAGLMPPAPEEAMWRANVGGTVGLLAGLRRADVHHARIVSIGSAAEYAPGLPSPIREDAPTGGGSAYGNTKAAQSLVTLQMAAQSGCSGVVARTFNLLGPGLSSHLVAGALVRQFVRAEAARPIRVGNTHTSRDFVDVRDAVRAYWLLAASEMANGIYNVCSGRSTSIGELLESLANVSGRAPAIESDPTLVRPSDPLEVIGDPCRLLQATGWRSEIPLQQSLRDMVAAA
jgi:GDP-4-dehydro-6-deoxy-D-mannose reductase